MSRRNRRPPESVSGTFAAVPHRLLDSVAFMGASHRARSLLFELLRQHNGINNGRLQLTRPYLAERGWRSSDQIRKAEAELIERGLIVKTKQGGLNHGPNWFALSWLAISDFRGLDIQASGYSQGAYSLLDPLPGKDLPVIRNCVKRAVVRTGAGPYHGQAEPLTGPYYGPKTPNFYTSTSPYHGNNVSIPLPPLQTKKCSKRFVVGKAGKSGKRVVGTQNGTSHNPKKTIRVVELSENRCEDKR